MNILALYICSLIQIMELSMCMTKMRSKLKKKIMLQGDFGIMLAFAFFLNKFEKKLVVMQ